MHFKVVLSKIIDIHSEGASVDRYLLSGEMELPFPPSVGLDICVRGTRTCRCDSIAWGIQSESFHVRESEEVIHLNPEIEGFQTPERVVEHYIKEVGWPNVEKLPKPAQQAQSR